MYIELRINDDERGYLVNEIDSSNGGWCWLDLNEDNSDEQHQRNEYGDGDKMYYFEAMGVHSFAVLDIIHANSLDEADKIVQERYKERFLRKTIVGKPVCELIDER